MLLPSKLETVNKLNEQSQNFGGYSNETWLARALTYNRYQTMTSGDDLWPDIPMVNAVQWGLIYSNGLSDIAEATTVVDCPTGYCDFNKAQTLSVRHKCSRRSDIVYEPGNGTFAPYQTLPGTKLKFFTRGAKEFEEHWITAASDTTYPKRGKNGTIFGNKQDALIVRTSMMINLGDGADKNVDNGTFAVDCALWWTVKTTHMYVNATKSFQLSGKDDNSIEVNLRRNSGGTLYLDPQTCIVEGQKIPFRNETSYYDECQFRVGREAQIGLKNLLTDEEYGLRGNMFLVQSYANGTKRWSRRNPFIANLWYSSYNESPETALKLIDAMWANIAFAASYTARRAQSVRQGKPSQNLYVTGTVSALVVYYKIDWRRLTLPALIVFCCALFVLYTALFTRKEYAWRRSALPLLFHGLEDHERHAQGDVRDFNVMQDVAKEIHVRLTEHVDANGARFTTQD